MNAMRLICFCGVATVLVVLTNCRTSADPTEPVKQAKPAVQARKAPQPDATPSVGAGVNDDETIEAIRPGLTEAEAEVVRQQLREIRSREITSERHSNDFFYAGLKDEEVAEFLRELKGAIARDDRAKVASLVRYPTEVRLNGKGELTSIEDAQEFVAKYPAIMTERVLRDIATAEVSNLFANWKGVKIGRGSIWFAGLCEDRVCGQYKLMITRINNHPIPGNPER
jgi:hypothetical protein